MAKVFGELEGLEVGQVFSSRQELADAGIHSMTQAGISGNPKEGADAVVVSGGYEDDEDYGNFIVYTGQGGNDPNTKKQVADQELVRGNAGLVTSHDRNLPVRVIRKVRVGGRDKYRYDGLFEVESWFPAIGRSGHRIFRYRLVKVGESGEIPESMPGNLPSGNSGPRRVTTKVSRVVRDTAVTDAVKKIHNFQCQVCAVKLEKPGGPYAEGAHIRPLGTPHNGPDIPENVLCLCPNCHVLFDGWAFCINDNGQINGSKSGSLRRHRKHKVDPAYLAYHRALFETL